MKKIAAIIGLACVGMMSAVMAYQPVAEKTPVASSTWTADAQTHMSPILLAATDDVGACSQYKRFGGNFLSCSYTTESECTGSATVKVEWVRNGSC